MAVRRDAEQPGRRRHHERERTDEGIAVAIETQSRVLHAKQGRPGECERRVAAEEGSVAIVGGRARCAPRAAATLGEGPLASRGPLCERRQQTVDRERLGVDEKEPPRDVAPASGQPGDEGGVHDQWIGDETELADVASSRGGGPEARRACGQRIADGAVEEDRSRPVRGIGRVQEELDQQGSRAGRADAGDLARPHLVHVAPEHRLRGDGSSARQRRQQRDEEEATARRATRTDHPEQIARLGTLGLTSRRRQWRGASPRARRCRW